MDKEIISIDDIELIAFMHPSINTLISIISSNIKRIYSTNYEWFLKEITAFYVCGIVLQRFNREMLLCDAQFFTDKEIEMIASRILSTIQFLESSCKCFMREKINNEPYAVKIVSYPDKDLIKITQHSTIEAYKMTRPFMKRLATRVKLLNGVDKLRLASFRSNKAHLRELSKEAKHAKRLAYWQPLTPRPQKIRL